MVQFILAKNDIYREDSFLFSVYKDIDPLSINDDFLRTQNKQINTLLDKYNIKLIEPWLKSATENDFDGDIYLNRIYRIKIDKKDSDNLIGMMDELKKISGVQYVERENLHKVFYTPNDSQYNQQWFLPEINSNDAWDFWNINGGELPGERRADPEGLAENDDGQPGEARRDAHCQAGSRGADRAARSASANC